MFNILDAYGDDYQGQFARILMWYSIHCQILPREKKKHEYNDALKARFKHLPEIKRIVKSVSLISTLNNTLCLFVALYLKHGVIHGQINGNFRLNKF